MEHFHSLHKTNNPPTEGTIIIVDISGFTQLVYNTDLITGRDILSKLLSSITEMNQLGLNISEIEGDAILYYKFGSPPCYTSVLKQFQLMRNNFTNNVKKINKKLVGTLNLSLKMIVHYGQITQYCIADFKKLYGKTVLESHLLLKNEVKSHSYVLMTNDFLNNASLNHSNTDYPIENEHCEVLRGVKRLCYRFFDFTSEIGLAS